MKAVFLHQQTLRHQSYPLVNIAIEHHHVQWVNPPIFKFATYVSHYQRVHPHFKFHGKPPCSYGFPKNPPGCPTTGAVGRGPDCCDPGGGRDSRGGKIWIMVTRVGWKDYGWNIWNIMDLWNGWKGDFIWILLGLHEITIRGSLDSTMISP